jgi:two-component system nitrate/nitrite response regulator NarL
VKLLLYSQKEGVLARWREALEPVAPGVREIVDAADLTNLSPENRVVLLHLHAGSREPASLVASLVEGAPFTRVMVFRDLPEDDDGLAMLRAGAAGYCNTYMNPPLLRMAVEIVRRGEIWAGQSLIRRLVSAVAGAAATPPAPAGLEGLTAREREIALLVASGASNKRIAGQLDITERTVKAHMSSLFRKTGARDRLQLALRINAARNGQAA